MRDLLITGGTLIVPRKSDETRLFAVSTDLAVRDDTILMVGERGELPGDFDPDVTVDAGGCAVIAGLVNAHCHAAMSLLRGYADDMPLMQWLQEKVFPAEAELVPSDIYWGTALAVVEMLQGGVTSFSDMYFHMCETAQAAADLGIRATLSVGMAGQQRNEDSLQQACEFHQQWHGTENDRIRVQLGPHAPYTCSPEFLSEVAALAEKLGCGVHMHLAETQDEVDTITQEYGVSPIQYVVQTGLTAQKPFTAAHCVHLKENDLALLKREGVRVAHCPQSNQKLGSGTAPLASILEEGVTVGLGTDGACSTSKLDVWSEMQAASLQQKVLNYNPSLIPARQALYLATRGGALAIGREDTGQLVPGFKADIAVVDLNSPHLQPVNDLISILGYCAGPRDVRDVFVDGHWLVRDGKLTVFDQDEVVTNAKKCSADLIKRVNKNADV